MLRRVIGAARLLGVANVCLLWLLASAVAWVIGTELARRTGGRYWTDARPLATLVFPPTGTPGRTHSRTATAGCTTSPPTSPTC
jgi:hypothetical protein